MKERIPATPAAKRLAKEKNIDLLQVAGTGPAGCILTRDILSRQVVRMTPLARAVAEYYNLPVDHPDFPRGKKVKKVDILKVMEGRQAAAAPQVRPLQGMRKVIAQRMLQSLQTAAQYTLCAEFEAAAVLELKGKIQPVILEKTGQKMTITDIFIKIVAAALEKHPIINSTLIKEEIIFQDEINVGVAVALEDGLMVPVMKNANRKSLKEITGERALLVNKAREGKLTPDEYSGGTFTISNMGNYPIDYFTPVINQPESAILGIGRTQEKVIAVKGKMEIRPMVGLSLTLDHRHVDGVEGAKFMATLQQLMNNPFALLI